MFCLTLRIQVTKPGGPARPSVAPSGDLGPSGEPAALAGGEGSAKPIVESAPAARPIARPSLRELAIYGALVLAATLTVAAVVVQDFRGTLLGPSNDENLFSYQAYYFSHNFSLLPFPHLNFSSDETFYPYGADQVFQPWGLEREYFGAVFRSLFGVGPWMQLYFLYSLVVTAVGAYVLLRRDYPGWRAMAIGLAVSFANFYAIGKYPGHLNIACPHWVVLGVIADFLIFSRVALRQPASARLLGARAALVTLSFGLDLGYICGIGLTSLALTAAISGVILAARSLRSSARFKDQWLEARDGLRASFRRHRVQVVLLGTLCAAPSLFYLPIIFQISSHAKGVGSLGDQGAAFASPLRLALPCLPGKHNAISLHHDFPDSPEGLFASSPGWMFVIPGILGLALARGRARLFAPLLALLALIVVYHPHVFPVLKPLPWFAYARVQGRLTIIYPALFAIFSLGVPEAWFRLWRGKVLACCALGLLATEVIWAYGGPMVRRHEDPVAQDGSFDPFMRTVRASEGEAVLEWPFCVSGGNGVGSPLNSYYDRLYTTFALRQFHEKKTVGQFFSRLHRSQVQPFFDHGWARLFSPDSPNIFTARRQSRDLTAQEWQFMEDFFALNDFCGVILYTDFLSPETLAGFRERFGSPVAATSFGRAGRMEFIRKPERLQARLDRERGRQVALAPAELREGQRIDLAGGAADAYLTCGWAPRPQNGPARSLAEREAVVEFRLESGGPVTLRCEMMTLYAQPVRMELNGRSLGEVALAAHRPQTIEASIDGEMLAPVNRLKVILPSPLPPQPGLGSVSVSWLDISPPEPAETAHSHAEIDSRRPILTARASVAEW